MQANATAMRNIEIERETHVYLLSYVMPHMFGQLGSSEDDASIQRACEIDRHNERRCDVDFGDIKVWRLRRCELQTSHRIAADHGAGCDRKARMAR